MSPLTEIYAHVIVLLLTVICTFFKFLVHDVY